LDVISVPEVFGCYVISLDVISVSRRSLDVISLDVISESRRSLDVISVCTRPGQHVSWAALGRTNLMCHGWLDPPERAREREFY
jgi:hypothetical protein